ncbi:MAG: replicative DNA helicase [Candidatus Glassbacteria bacterium]
MEELTVQSSERLVFDRTPPHSYEAEASVLGAMLMEKVAVTKALEHLDESCFYRHGHRLIFRSMSKLFEANKIIDPITLTEELRRRDELEEVGGQVYVTELLEAVPTAANVEYHINIVLEKALLRRLIEVATSIITETYEEKGDVNEILDRAESRIFEISQHRVKEGFISIKNILKSAFELIESLHQRKGGVTGVETGFIDLDNMTAGLQNSEFIVIAGRPSMGKTSFALNITQFAAVERGIPVAVFSLEMSRDQVVQRLLCSEARVDGSKLRTGFLSESDWPKLATAAGILAEAPIYIDDSPSTTILEMKAKARRLKSEVNLGLIIVDYLQLIQGPRGAENRQQEISVISRSLKALAKELKIPVVALSQLSRAPEMRKDRRPTLADLRESGAIEQDADVVVFIYRPEQYEKTGSEDVAEIIVGKQRNGPTGTIELYFRNEYTTFENLSRRTE